MASLARDIVVVLVAAAAFAAVVVGLAAAAVLYVKREWRRRRAGLVLSASGAAVAAGTASLAWLRSRPVPDRRWRRLSYARRHLARALAGAEVAVTEARTAGASLGDLPSLFARTQRAGQDADRSLRIAQHAGGAQDVTAALGRAAEIAVIATEISAAASAALSRHGTQSLHELEAHVRLELQAISTTAQ